MAAKEARHDMESQLIADKRGAVALRMDSTRNLTRDGPTPA